MLDITDNSYWDFNQVSDVEEAASVYSDVYKELYGIRPRWVRWNASTTADEIWTAVEELQALTAMQRDREDEYLRRCQEREEYEVQARIEQLELEAELNAGHEEMMLTKHVSRRSEARRDRKRHASRR